MSYDASSFTLQARSPSGPRVREPVDRVDEAVNTLRCACKAGGYHELAEHVTVIRHLVRHGRFRDALDQLPWFPPDPLRAAVMVARRFIASEVAHEEFGKVRREGSIDLRVAIRARELAGLHRSQRVNLATEMERALAPTKPIVPVDLFAETVRRQTADIAAATEKFRALVRDRPNLLSEIHRAREALRSLGR